MHLALRPGRCGVQLPSQVQTSAAAFARVAFGCQSLESSNFGLADFQLAILTTGVTDWKYCRGVGNKK